jgi:D-lactate dehydrogenase (cytochrome)
MGIKTKATFRLVRKPGGTAYASFGFQDRPEMVAMLCEVSRLGIASETFGFGRYHHELFSKEPTPSKKEARELLGRIIRSSSSRLRGLLDVTRVIRSGGVKFLEKWEHSVHIVVDGFDQGAADRGVAAIKRIAKRRGGKVLPPTMCIAMRMDPFQPVDRLILGPDGECSTPSHCIVPLSRAHELDAAVEKFFSDNESFMKEHGLTRTCLHICVAGMFGIEPILYWRDKLNPLRLSVARVERKEAFSKIPATPAATEAAIELRRRMVTMFKHVGGCHYQIGKFYPYRESVGSEDTWKLLEDMKSVVDPGRLMNPGVLGIR